MRKKRILLVVMSIFLILPAFLVNADANKNSEKKDASLTRDTGKIAAKDEVVYATLSPSGQQQDIYVVNIFEVLQAGNIVDYGDYDSVINLTNLSEISQLNKRVEFPAPKGKFYYQGNLDHQPLPWDIEISYKLDGKTINPEKLAGKNGHLQLNMQTSANENADPAFFENYLLQISLTLNPDIYSNIEAGDGMMANAGKNKLVTYTVMPGNEGILSLEADVVNFELESIEISAVPSSMSIDVPDVDEMSGDMKLLSDAIGELNKGVADFKKGLSQLNGGVTDLQSGSQQYKDGISEIDRNSSELVRASASINGALSTISDNLRDNADKMDLSFLDELGDLEALPEGLVKVGNGLHDIADGLSKLKENYSNAYRLLEAAIEAIPESDMTDEDIQSLKNSDANPAVVERLLETYEAALKVKETYGNVTAGFEAVNEKLATISEYIRDIGDKMIATAEGLSSALEGIAALDSLSQLQEGLTTLSSNYQQFHTGLVGYTEGVSQLSSSYAGLHSGIVQLSGGTNDLEAGAGELHNGTSTLHESTSDLPEQMQEEIDKMISEYDKSDFESVSFISADNEKVNSVQFVIKTESIKIPEQETSEEPKEEKKNFWTRLWDLFF